MLLNDKLLISIDVNGQDGMKSGTCPAAAQGIKGKCFSDCVFDTDCEGTLKCCPASCKNGKSIVRCTEAVHYFHYDPIHK